VRWEAAKMQEKMAEYAMAVLKDKPTFHINFLMDISPNCDCWNFNDMPIVPNIGITASFDPVAIDKASVDLVNDAQTNKGCVIDNDHSLDKFTSVFPKTDWRICLDYAEKIGLGTQQYDLVKVV
jgi:uncharacterized protein